MKYKVSMLFITLLTFISILPGHAATAAPYDGYSYSHWGTAVHSPIAYLPEEIIDGAKQGAGSFNAPSDLYAASDGKVYILDAGNGRIVIFDREWKVVGQMQGFLRDGVQEQFANPQGIFVTDKGRIYIADTGNRRIIELTKDGGFVREIGAPTSDIIRPGFEFLPIKLAVDRAGRIYTVGRGVFDGIMEFDSDGVFTGFIGTNRVKFNAWDYFWKSVSTRAQRDQLVQFVPLEFNNLDLDGDGFVYTTTAERNSEDPIKKLNSKGIDVLRRNGNFPPSGDLLYVEGSALNDIAVGEHGVYSVLDSKRGRIFTYNEEGILMYVFGRLGEQEGTFVNPVSIDRAGDRLLVLDRNMNRITVFAPTRFGVLANEANELFSLGRHDEAADKWKQLLQLDANNETAYVGIGKALLRQGEHKQAMEHLKLGYDREYYSKSFGKYRKDLLRNYFGTFMTSLVAAFAIYMIWRWARRRSKERVQANVH